MGWQGQAFSRPISNSQPACAPEVTVAGGIDEDGRAPCLTTALGLRHDGAERAPLAIRCSDTGVELHLNAGRGAELLEEELHLLGLIAEPVHAAAVDGLALAETTHELHIEPGLSKSSR